MQPFYCDDVATLYHGDSLEVMATLPSDSVDAVVSDPPYGLDFMGRGWDHGIPGAPYWAEALRVAKPGAHLVAFGGSRTYHRLTCAIEDAGWQIRDSVAHYFDGDARAAEWLESLTEGQRATFAELAAPANVLAWVYGSGQPKSLDVSQAIDSRKDWGALELLQGAIRSAREALGITQSEAARRAGIIAEGETLGGGGYMWFETGRRIPTAAQFSRLKTALELGDDYDDAFAAAERVVTGSIVHGDSSLFGQASGTQTLSDPLSVNGKAWKGWGTALKPAWEPIILARKPLCGTVAANVIRYGTGGLNVDACRLGEPYETRGGNGVLFSHQRPGAPAPVADVAPAHPLGRWPANVMVDDVAAAALDAQAPDVGGAAPVTGSEPSPASRGVIGNPRARVAGAYHEDEGGASRFFYNAKASRAERDAGLRGWQSNIHPTVKPLDTMRWLVRLVVAPGGVVLDPFTGSGTTGCACMREDVRFIGIDKGENDSAEYLEIAAARMRYHRSLFQPDLFAP